MTPPACSSPPDSCHLLMGIAIVFYRIHYSLEGNAAGRRVERGLFNTRGGRFQRPSSWYVVPEGSPSLCVPLQGCHSEILPFPKLDTPSFFCICTACVWWHLVCEAPSPRHMSAHYLHVPTSKAFWQTTCRSNVCERVSERRCKYSLITWHGKIRCGRGGVVFMFCDCPTSSHLLFLLGVQTFPSKINSGPGRESRECPLAPCPVSLYWQMCVQLLSRARLLWPHGL